MDRCIKDRHTGISLAEENPLIYAGFHQKNLLVEGLFILPLCRDVGEIKCQFHQLKPLQRS